MKEMKLNVKDMIFLAVLNVVVIISYAIIVALCCSTGIGLFFCTAVAFLLLGSVYMLMVRRCAKKGTYIICGILMGFVGIIGGRIGTTLGCVLGGIVADYVAGNYQRRGRVVLGYIVYALSFALGIYLPGLIFGATYLTSRMAAKGIEGNALLGYIQYFNITVISLVAAFNALCAAVGAIIGNGIVDKHFVKAGIVKPESYDVFSYENAIRKEKTEKTRKRIQNPEKILNPFVKAGMRVIDYGCGTGYFTLPMAKMVGKYGHVYGIDIQKDMLTHVEGKVVKEKLEQQVTLLQCTENYIPTTEIVDSADFALLFGVAHEVADRELVFTKLYESLKKEGRILLAEPKLHVSKSCFEQTIQIAKAAGFSVEKGPSISMMKTVVLVK